MKKILTFLKTRVLKYWQTSLTGLLILLGMIWFNKGKIDFSEFTTYIALIPTIILLLMKNFKNEKA